MGDENTSDFPWRYVDDPNSWFASRPRHEWERLAKLDLVKPSLVHGAWTAEHQPGMIVDRDAMSAHVIWEDLTEETLPLAYLIWVGRAEH